MYRRTTEIERYDGESDKSFLSRQRRQRHKAAIYTRVLEAAQAGAERLCPARSSKDKESLPMGPQSMTEKIEVSKFSMEFSRKDAEKVKERAEKAPGKAARARKVVERMEKWSEKHEDDA